MGPVRKKPAVSLSKVPSVKELCDRLGFERASPREVSVFTDTTHAFRKSYKTTNGSPGSDLVDWYSTEVQKDLSAMALDFLEQAGNGERFWSDSRRWKDVADNLTWPDDKTLIADLLRQLFWKQNKYALNNQTYGERKYGESRDQSRDRISPKRDGPLMTSVDSSPTLQSASERHRPSFSGLSSTPLSFGPKKPVISLLDDDRTEVVNQMQSTLPLNSAGPMTDIFDVPEDDSFTGTQPRVDTPRHGHSKRASEKSSPRSGGKKPSGDSPSAKRPRIGDKGDGKKVSKRPMISPKRTSNRPKAPRIRPGTVPSAQIEEYLKENTPEDGSFSGDELFSAPTSVFGSPIRSAPLGGSSSFDRLPSLSSTVSPGELANAKQGSTVGVMATRPAILSATMNDSDLSSPKDKAQSTSNRGQTGKSPHHEVSTQDNSGSRRAAQRQETSSIPTAKSPAHVPVPKPTEPSITPEPISKPKPKVQGAFWIVTSPDPNYMEETWNNGQIKGKSLSTVIEEISSITRRDCIEKLKIKLKTPFAQTTMTVHKDAEDQWETAKQYLEDKIKEAFTRDRNQQFRFHIWIEPLYEQNAPLGGMDNFENEEIDW